MNRREFIALLAGSIASCMIPRMAFADSDPNSSIKQNDDPVHITESIAYLMSERFFSALKPSGSFFASSAIPFFDSTGAATGFIVHISNDDSPYGYVIFDSKCPFGIAEFAYGDNAALSPWENTAIQISRSTYTSADTTFFQIDPLTYARFDNNTGKGFNNYGESIESSSYGIDLYKTGIDARSSTPDQWTDSNVFLNAAEVYRNYNIAAANSVSGYSAYSETYVEQITNRYACAVSAMLTTCSYYGATGGQNNLYNDYLSLWNLSGTNVDHTSNGITYGSTPTRNIGQASKSFCSQNGKNISYSYSDSADWAKYKSCTDSRNMSIFSAELAGNSNSGHSMAVTGYMTIVNKDNVLDFMNTLMVCDGWSTGNRILNHNTGHYTWHNGTFFSS